MTEYQLHIQVAKFLNTALDGNSLWLHCPNGGYRSFTEAKRFKGMGVMGGVPDILVFNDGRAIGLELKGQKGRVSNTQLYCHEQFRRARVPVSVCRDLEEVIAALKAAGVPLKSRIAA